MHLLFTDPSTSPRTELGRIAFGVLYGLSTVVLYVVLGRAGAPTFYDKLLQVPLLNLSVILIDRAARSAVLRRFDPAALGRSLGPRRRHLAYMGVWAVVFVAISAAGGVGDRHPGQWVPFWQQACEEGRPHACGFLLAKQAGLCNMGSGWACNEAGVLQAGLAGRGGVGADREGDGQVEALFAFQPGCELGFEAACGNYQAMVDDGGLLERAPPTVEDYPIVLRGSKGDHGPLAGGAVCLGLSLGVVSCLRGWQVIVEHRPFCHILAIWPGTGRPTENIFDRFGDMRTATKLRVRVKLYARGQLQTAASMKLQSLYRPLHLTKKCSTAIRHEAKRQVRTPGILNVLDRSAMAVALDIGRYRVLTDDRALCTIRGQLVTRGC